MERTKPAHSLIGDTDEEKFVGFARVFSGRLRPDRPCFVVGPKYDVTDPLTQSHIQLDTQPVAVYMMMGRELIALPEAPAGNIIAVGGLSTFILKTATLCSTPVCVSLKPMAFQVRACHTHLLQSAQFAAL